jgi:hypothetical protein
MSFALAFVLHRARGRDAVPADDFVRRLTIAAGAHGAHDELLRRHERQLVATRWRIAPDAPRGRSRCCPSG